MPPACSTIGTRTVSVTLLAMWRRLEPSRPISERDGCLPVGAVHSPDGHGHGRVRRSLHCQGGSEYRRLLARW